MPYPRAAEAVAEGARQAGATVDVRRVPEPVPEDVARKAGYRRLFPAGEGTPPADEGFILAD